MNIKISTLKVTGLPSEDENPLPTFCDRVRDKKIKHDGTFGVKEEKLFGYRAGKSTLPYNTQSKYSPGETELWLKTIEMENECLKAVFLPEYGARLYSLVNKETGKDIFCKNKIFRPRYPSRSGSKFSGGVEWRMGHSIMTCGKMFAGIVRAHDDSEFLRFYEFERSSRLFYLLDFYLPKDSRTLNVYVKIINANDTPLPMYWWTDTSLELERESRVLAGSDTVIYRLPTVKVDPDSSSVYGIGEMPGLPPEPNTDFSYPTGLELGCEYYFQYGKNRNPEKNPWSAYAYRSGRLVVERSTNPLNYRGVSRLPGISPKNPDRLALQSGLAPTRVHGKSIPAQSHIDFTQCFGEYSTEPKLLTDVGWREAKKTAAEIVEGKIPATTLNRLHLEYADNALRSTESLISFGSGWGALEFLRLERSGYLLPEGMKFPAESMTHKELVWAELLLNGRLENLDDDYFHSWMTQPEWMELLEKSLQNTNNRNWFSLAHMGVMYYESGDESKAEQFFSESVKQEPTDLAYRCLAVISADKHDFADAVEYMEKAYEVHGEFRNASYAEEYLTLLNRTKKYQEAWEFFYRMPEEYAIRDHIRLVMAVTALELGNIQYLTDFFNSDFHLIDKDKWKAIELWYKYMATLESERRGVPYSDKLLEEVRDGFALPDKLS